MIEIGVSIDQRHASYADMRRAWVTADELEIDQIFASDHFFPQVGEFDGPYFEGMALLAAMAEVTERARIGLLVACNGYRNPNLLADMHRTVDHIAAGRVILGIGSGWFEKDFVEYGYEFGTAGSRVRDLARDLPVIRRRLAALNPPPVRPVPILVAGTGEKVMLRLVAEHANIWNAIGDPETVAHKASVLDDWCATVGRDPKEIQRSVYMTDLERHPEDYVASGFTQFVYDVPPPYDVTVMRDLLAWRDGRNAATNASAGTG